MTYSIKSDKIIATDERENGLTYRQCVRLYLARDTEDWDMDFETWLQINLDTEV